MRFAIAGIVVIACVACTRERATPGASSAPGGSVTPAVLVPAPLAWSHGERDALAALTRAGMAPRSEAQHGYFSTPGQFHAAPGTIEVAHTIEPLILFTPRAGWTGIAHYPTVGGTLDQIELRGDLSPTAARAELAALTRRLGRPDDQRAFPAATGETLRAIWVRGGVWLVVLVEPEGTITQTYRRDDRPATEIGPP